MSLLLSSFYPQANAVLTSGNQQITGLKTFNERINVREIRGIGLAGAFRRIDPTLGHLYSNTAISLDYFQRILSGDWKFNLRPTVNGVGVLLEGEGGGGGTVILPSDILFTTGTQTVTGPKNFTARPTLSGLNLITTGDLVNLELNITGDIIGSTVFDGNREIKRQTWPANEDLGGSTISEFLENVFFPYIGSTVSMSEFAIRSYGTDSINGNIFAGSIDLKDDAVTGIAYRSFTNILSGPFARSVGGSYTTAPVAVPFGTSLTASTSQIYNTLIYATHQGESFTRTSNVVRVRFEPRYYFGVSNNPDLGAGITTLTPSNPALYTYSHGSRPPSVTHTGFAPSSQYIYFAYPSPESTQDSIINWGNSLSSIFETNSNFEYISSYQQLAPVTVSFTHKNLRYRIYRSNNILALLPGQSFTLRFTFGA